MDQQAHYVVFSFRRSCRKSYSRTTNVSRNSSWVVCDCCGVSSNPDQPKPEEKHKKKNMSQSWKPPHMRGDTRLFFRSASCRCGIHTAEGMWEECERCGGGFSKKGTPEGAYTLVTDCEAQHSALSSHESKCPTFASMFVLRSDLSAVVEAHHRVFAGNELVSSDALLDHIRGFKFCPEHQNE